MSLSAQPRVRLATLPTPLHELPRLREALGGAARCPRILMKRDDLTGLALGGNKIRKLEYILGDALKRGATAVITTGAVQSNHNRQTAAAARLHGLRCVLVVTTYGDEPADLQGNLLLDHLFKADVRIFPRPRGHVPGREEDDAIAAIAAELRAAGEVPYVIPVGGSSPQGAFGYVGAILELEQQLTDMGEAPGWLYYSSGSRGTQAGVVLGAKMFQAGYRVHGVAVSSGEPEKTVRAMTIANAAAELLGTPVRVTEKDLVTDERYMGPEYGMPTDAALEAILLLAETEGILLDPAYTGKGMAGLLADVREGRLRPDETVVFIHTGGAPALFAHVPELERALAARRSTR